MGGGAVDTSAKHWYRENWADISDGTPRDHDDTEKNPGHSEPAPEGPRAVTSQESETPSTVMIPPSPSATAHTVATHSQASILVEQATVRAKTKEWKLPIATERIIIPCWRCAKWHYADIRSIGGID